LTQIDRNLEMMRRGLENFSRGAFEEAAAEIHPEIEWHVAFRLPDLPPSKEIYRGQEEVLALWRAFSTGWETLRLDLEKVIHADEQRMLLRVRFVGRGTESGAQVDRVLFQAYRFRDGLLAYSHPFDDEPSARRDLDLPDG